MSNHGSSGRLQLRLVSYLLLVSVAAIGTWMISAQLNSSERLRQTSHHTTELERLSAALVTINRYSLAAVFHEDPSDQDHELGLEAHPKLVEAWAEVRASVTAVSMSPAMAPRAQAVEDGVAELLDEVVGLHDTDATTTQERAASYHLATKPLIDLVTDELESLRDTHSEHVATAQASAQETERNLVVGLPILAVAAAAILMQLIVRYRDQRRIEALMIEAEKRDRFIATVSHELRTPLTGLVGMAALLAEGVNLYDPTEAEMMARIVRQEGEELSAIVDDLLAAGRMTGSVLTVKSEVVELMPLVRRAVERLELQVRLTSAEASVVAIGDPLRIRQIVRNLLTNADRYGGRDIEVAIQTLPDSVELTVSDDGPGVGDAADTIFEPYAVASTSITQPDSVGLGLTVARDLARLMDGELIYERVDARSVFTLTLPAPVTAQGSSETPATPVSRFAATRRPEPEPVSACGS